MLFTCGQKTCFPDFFLALMNVLVADCPVLGLPVSILTGVIDYDFLIIHNKCIRSVCACILSHIHTLHKLSHFIVQHCATIIMCVCVLHSTLKGCSVLFSPLVMDGWSTAQPIMALLSFLVTRSVSTLVTVYVGSLGFDSTTFGRA